MKIFKYKENDKHYTIEIIQNSYPILDGRTRLGVHAHPYRWIGDVIFFKSVDFNGKCKTFIEDNFIEITEI